MDARYRPTAAQRGSAQPAAGRRRPGRSAGRGGVGRTGRLRLARAAALLVTPHEAVALREAKLGGYAAVYRLRPRGETDATFLVRRVAALAGDDFTREAFYDGINPSCELLAANDTPARTREKFGPAPVVFRDTPLRRGRPDLRAGMARAPLSLRRLPATDGLL